MDHGGRCYFCGTLLTAETMTIDHLIPKCKGGTNALSNLMPACEPCNRKKGRKFNAKIFLGKL